MSRTRSLVVLYENVTGRKSAAPCGIAAAVTPRRVLRRRSRASRQVRCDWCVVRPRLTVRVGSCRPLLPA